MCWNHALSSELLEVPGRISDERCCIFGFYKTLKGS
jgi:hypothetical protein